MADYRTNAHHLPPDAEAAAVAGAYRWAEALWRGSGLEC